MITFNIREFIAEIARSKEPRHHNSYNLGGKLLAIDPGTKKIGLAVSDEKQALIIDSLTYCVENLSQGIEFIKLKYFTENSPEKSASIARIIGIIIGFPFSHSRKNNWPETIIEFAEGLQETLKNFDIPIYFKDESYSTVSANFLTQNFTKKRQKQHKDRLAASCILQETLDIIALYKSESEEKN